MENEMKGLWNMMPMMLAFSLVLNTSLALGQGALKLGSEAIGKVVKYNMPCLTVSEAYGGKLSYLPMTVAKGNGSSPLRVMIVDDTPNGSGQSIHSSIWMASVLAAMLRNDTMHGVTITVEFTGNVDGPSAGGVTCLTILSALDGLPLPDDFAMTGTILPDGTIGVVGGVPDKMRAAAVAGVKRIFIPAFQRIVQEKDGDAIKDVDLQRLADELKVELHFVENILEAYSILHNKPLERRGYINMRQVTRLPKEMEDVLVKCYNKYLALVMERAKKSPEDSKTVLADGYALSPVMAQSLYQEGKLLPAAITIFHSWQAWQAFDKANAFLEKFSLKKPDWSKIDYLREYHLRKLIVTLGEDMDEYFKKNTEEKAKKEKEYFDKNYGTSGGDKLTGYFPNSKSMTEITAQLEPIGVEERLWGAFKTCDMRRLSKEQIEKASLKELEQAWGNEIDILYLMSLIMLDDSEYTDYLREFGELFPKMNSVPRAQEVERLFHSAAIAVDTVAHDNYMASAESARADSENQSQNILESPVLYPYFEFADHASYCHSLLLPDSPKKPTNLKYHTQASLKANMGQFALAAALVIWYGPDQSNDFLPHLWRLARASAVHNISECIAAGVPCPSAIYDFQMAETNVNSDTAPIWGLVSYWRASLYSKALMMSFK